MLQEEEEEERKIEKTAEEGRGGAQDMPLSEKGGLQKKIIKKRGKSLRNEMTEQYFRKEANRKKKKRQQIRRAANLNCNLKGGRLFAATRKGREWGWSTRSRTRGGGRVAQSLHATSENFQLDRVVRSLFVIHPEVWKFLGNLGRSGKDVKLDGVERWGQRGGCVFLVPSPPGMGEVRKIP